MIDTVTTSSKFEMKAMGRAPRMMMAKKMAAPRAAPMMMNMKMMAMPESALFSVDQGMADRINVKAQLFKEEGKSKEFCETQYYNKVYKNISKK